MGGTLAALAAFPLLATAPVISKLNFPNLIEKQLVNNHVKNRHDRYFRVARQRLAYGPSAKCQYPCCSQEDMVMDRFDFSPLFRSTIGFDRLTRLVDAATRVDSTAAAYPPYNIEKTGEDA
jgi:hypothetical protein